MSPGRHGDGFDRDGDESDPDGGIAGGVSVPGDEGGSIDDDGSGTDAGRRDGTGRDPTRTRAGVWRRPLAVAALAVVPWTVVAYPGGVDLVFAWGLVTTAPPGVVDLWSYLFVYTAGPRSLPRRLVAWPASAALFALALASATLAVVGREDRRVTAALLALSGLVHLRVALGLVALGGTALPVGPAALLGAARWALGRGSGGSGDR